MVELDQSSLGLESRRFVCWLVGWLPQPGALQRFASVHLGAELGNKISLTISKRIAC